MTFWVVRNVSLPLSPSFYVHIILSSTYFKYSCLSLRSSSLRIQSFRFSSLSSGMTSWHCGCNISYITIIEGALYNLSVMQGTKLIIISTNTRACATAYICLSLSVYPSIYVCVCLHVCVCLCVHLYKYPHMNVYTNPQHLNKLQSTHILKHWPKNKANNTNFPKVTNDRNYTTLNQYSSNTRKETQAWLGVRAAWAFYAESERTGDLNEPTSTYPLWLLFRCLFSPLFQFSSFFSFCFLSLGIVWVWMDCFLESSCVLNGG